MNFGQIQSQVLRRLRIDPAQEDSHLKQVARDTINGVMQDALSRQMDWGFLHKTAEILTEKDDDLYALPVDFGYCQNVFLNGVKAEGYPSDKQIFYTDSAATVNITNPAFTIRTLTSAPFFSAGTIFPTARSAVIPGLATAFDSRVVGRFFRSKRDGQLYEVLSIQSATQITLSRDFGGNSVAGRVKAFADDLTLIHGDPGVTNFHESMTGRFMRIEGDGTTNFLIDTVDEINQRITLTTAITSAGSDLIYSIQDDYEIDPAGQFILKILPTPTEDDVVIAVDYMGTHFDLVADGDLPVIPRQFHQTIVYGSAAEVGRITNFPDANMLATYDRKFERGVISMMLNDDPMGTSIHYSAEPDTVRHNRTTIAP